MAVRVMLTRRNVNRFACSALYAVSGFAVAARLAPPMAKPAVSVDGLSRARAEWETLGEKLLQLKRSYKALSDIAEECARRRKLRFGRYASCRSCEAALEAAEMRAGQVCDLYVAAERRWLALRDAVGGLTA